MRRTIRWSGALLLLVALDGCALPPEVDWRPYVSGGLSPQSSQALAARAKRDFEAGRFGLAIEAYSKLAEREPYSVDALNGLAASYDRIGRFDLAGREYRKALARAPNSAETLNNIGFSAYLQGRPFLALAFFDEASAVAGEIPQVRNNRRLVERFLLRQSLGMCGAPDRRGAAAREDALPKPPPRPEGVRLERVDMFTERLVTQPVRPEERARDSERTRRLLKLLTPRSGGGPAEPEAQRQDCPAAPATWRDRSGDLRPGRAPAGAARRASRSERGERAKRVPDFADLGELTDSGLLVDRRSQLLPLGS